MCKYIALCLILWAGIHVLPGCHAAPNTEAAVVTLLNSMASAECNVKNITGEIEISDMDRPPAFFKKKIEAPNAPANRWTIRFLIEDRKNMQFSAYLNDTPSESLLYKADRIIFSGKDLGNWEALLDERAPSPEIAALRADALWLYAVVMGHLFPLTNSPSFNQDVFRSLLARAELTICDPKESYPNRNAQNENSDVLCVEYGIGPNLRTRYLIWAGKYPAILQSRESLDDQSMADVCYDNPLETDIQGQTVAFMTDADRNGVDFGHIKTRLKNIDARNAQ